MLRRITSATIVLVLAGLLAAPASAAPRRPLIVLQPLGSKLGDRQILAVRRAIVAFYDVDVQIARRRALPNSAYYPPRKRHRADKLLDWLEPQVPKGARLVLALTASDISTTKLPYKDWGVLGLATLDGKVSIISLFRCRRRARSARHALVRLMKVAVHEVGHNLGLDHCPHRGCLMEDARGSVLTTDRERDLCSTCRRKLMRRGIRLPRVPERFWESK